MSITLNPGISAGSMRADQLFSFIETDTASHYDENLNVPFAILLNVNHGQEKESSVFSIFSPSVTANGGSSRDLRNLDVSKMHQHNYFEMMFMLEGSLYQIVEGKRYFYTEGAACLVNRHTLHMEEFLSEYTNIFLLLSSDFIRQLLNYSHPFLFAEEQELRNNKLFAFFNANLNEEHDDTQDFLDMVPLISHTQQKDMVHDLFEQIIRVILFPYPGASYKIMELIIRLLTILGSSEYYETNHVFMNTRNESLLFYRVNQLLKQYNGRITNARLAELLSYDGSYLGKIVRRHTGKSLFDYSMEFTMQAAADMLRNTDASISEICEKLNFSNRTHFYKIFQRFYNMTPSQFRNLNRL